MPHGASDYQKVAMADAVVAIDANPSGVAVWRPVGGLLSVVEEGDATREDTGGLSDTISHLVTGRERRFVVTAFRLLNPDTGALDPGQALLVVWGGESWSTSLTRAQVTLPGSATPMTFTCTIDTRDPAGDEDGFATIEATLHVAGSVT